MLFDRIQSWIRRRAKFSLRTGLALFLLLSILFGVVARWIHNVRTRGDAQLWLVGRTEAYYEQNEKPSWSVKFIRNWVHPEYERKLDGIALGHKHSDEDHLGRLTMLFGAKQIVVSGEFNAAALDRVFQTPGLKMLNLGCQVTSANETGQWNHVKQATKLESIEFREERKIPDSLVEEMAQLPRIKHIRVDCENRENLTALCKARSAVSMEFLGSEGKWVESKPTRRNPSPTQQATLTPPRAVFDELARRPNVDRLFFMHLEMNDPAAIQDFCEHSNVTELVLVTRINPECLSQIAELKRLTKLVLWLDPVNKDHLRVLKTMTKLKSLNIGNRTQPELLDELQKALPDCTIGKM